MLMMAWECVIIALIVLIHPPYFASERREQAVK